MTKPNFFIVGAAKSGTTSLYHYLLQNPQLSMPSWKEPHFFGEYRLNGPTIQDFKSYCELFSECAGHDAVGEASTQYLYSPSAPQEIAEHHPNARIIILLRNPIDRAYSLFWNHVRDGAEGYSFEEALELENTRYQLGWPPGFHYVRSGMYSAQLERYLRVFDDSSIKILLFEDLKEKPDLVLSEICKFLCIDSSFKFSVSKVYNRSGPPKLQLISYFLHNSSTIKRWLLSPLPRAWKDRKKLQLRDFNVGKAQPMKGETRSNLIEVFRKDIRRLEKLIDRDLSHWLANR